jgi:hypothetical protein
VSNGEKFDRLRELHHRMTAGLVFLVYQVRSEAEVGVIFETLNEPGRGLSDLEKVKNYLLYLSRTIADNRSAQLAPCYRYGRMHQERPDRVGLTGTAV